MAEAVWQQVAGTYEDSSWKPRAESSHLELQAGSGEDKLEMAQDFWHTASSKITRP